jgi:hypothetical protein
MPLTLMSVEISDVKMNCPKCGNELIEQKHFWPDPSGNHGVVQNGLPENWYSYFGNNLGNKPQDGGRCTKCDTHCMKIKNGDIYTWNCVNDLGIWELFKKRETHRPNARPIGGRWVQ